MAIEAKAAPTTGNGKVQDGNAWEGGWTVNEAIRRVLRDLGGIGKNQRNKEQNYNYRGIDDVLKELHPLLAEHGLVIAPDVIEREYEERVSKSGTVGHCAHLHVRYTVYGPDGSSIVLSSWGEGLDYGDKATNKAMTGAFKYMLFQLFAVADPADDADHETPDGGTKVQPAPSRPSADWQPVEPNPSGSSVTASSWPTRHETDGTRPPGPACPTEGCTGHLRQRTTKKGDPFLVCDSWKSRTDTGCGMTPLWDTTIEDYTEGAEDFENVRYPDEDVPAAEVRGLRELLASPAAEELGTHADYIAEIKRLVAGLDPQSVKDVILSLPNGHSILSPVSGGGWKVNGAALKTAGEAVQIEIITALTEAKS